MENNIYSLELGNFLKSLRIEKKLSIEKLAYKTGISYTLLYKIEKGTVNSSFIIILKILSNLNCDSQNMLILLDKMMATIKNNKTID